MRAITYHPDFNKYDLGLEHPLVGDKPKKTMEMLEKTELIKEFDVLTPSPATEEDILRVHTPGYLQRIKELSKKGGMLSVDTPAPKGIFEVASLATGGTIECGSKLFENYSITVNPLGGFHHASQNQSSGFCFFNDIAIVIEYLRMKKHLKKFLIMDLDVHHGNGTEDIYRNDPSVVNISIHQDGRTLYPGTGQIEEIGEKIGAGHTINVPLPPGTGSKPYLTAFTEIAPQITKEFDPEIIIYQAGVDTHHTDPLADISLTYQTYYELAKNVRELSEETCNKLLVLLGGGYNSTNCIHAYENIFRGLLGTDTFVTETNPYTFHNMGKVQDTITELKNILNQYWNLKN
jgi:acetoin utilization deacetylase AcuC-like enzyme